MRTGILNDSLLAAVIVAGLLLPGRLPAATQDMTVVTPGGWRHAVLAQADTPRKTPRPLVLVFHGHTASAVQALGLQRSSPSPLAQWVDIAEHEDILVVALDGNKGSDNEQGWNDCRADATNNPKSDDVAFARAVVKKLVDSGQADSRRLYAMGMSNGGMMALRLGQQMPELAAVAAVSASMAADSSCREKISEHTGLLLISGDTDPLVPWTGGQVRFGRSAARGGVMPVSTSFSVWAAAHMLDVRKVQSKELPPQFRNDKTRARISYFGNSPATSLVTLVQVMGGGHVEPSIEHRYRSLYLQVVGAQSSVFESADFAWDFFKNKTR